MALARNQLTALLTVMLLVGGAAAPLTASSSGSCCSVEPQEEDVSQGITPEERRVQGIGAQLNCLCPGCRAQISNCPHVQCGFAVPVRAEIAAMVSEGLTDKEILDKMVEKHGTEILCTPPAEGVNIGAYLTPVLFVLGGAIGAVFLLLRWQRSARLRAEESESRSPAASRPLDDRVEAHLSNLD